jgi:hypothetical protein
MPEMAWKVEAIERRFRGALAPQVSGRRVPLAA